MLFVDEKRTNEELLVARGRLIAEMNAAREYDANLDERIWRITAILAIRSGKTLPDD